MVLGGGEEGSDGALMCSGPCGCIRDDVRAVPLQNYPREHPSRLPMARRGPRAAGGAAPGRSPARLGRSRLPPLLPAAFH